MYMFRQYVVNSFFQIGSVQVIMLWQAKRNKPKCFFFFLNVFIGWDDLQ